MTDQIKSLLLALSITFFGLSIIFFPEESFQASLRGIELWLEVVFPALLPFFIVAEIMLAVGIVQFIGILLEPIMRPLFNVPGAGGVVIGIGLSSGYPAGAKITSQLRKEEIVNRTEGERLVSFTNASNPLFIFGAVSIGFFHNAAVGILLAASHYIGSLLVGLCMRFYKRNDRSEDSNERDNERILKRAWRALHTQRMAKNQPLGAILGNSVMSAIRTLCMIGGFIILFSVLNKLLTVTGVTAKIASFIEHLLFGLSWIKDFSIPIISSIFEVTLGAEMISQTEHTTLLAQLLVVSAVLAFNGLSIQSQIAAILSETDIRFTPYFFSRFLHIIFATTLTFLLYKPLYVDRMSGTPAMQINEEQTDSSWFHVFYETFTEIGPFFTLGTLILFFIFYARSLIKKH